MEKQDKLLKNRDLNKIFAKNEKETDETIKYELSEIKNENNTVNDEITIEEEHDIMSMYNLDKCLKVDVEKSKNVDETIKSSFDNTNLRKNIYFDLGQIDDRNSILPIDQLISILHSKGKLVLKGEIKNKLFGDITYNRLCDEFKFKHPRILFYDIQMVKSHLYKGTTMMELVGVSNSMFVFKFLKTQRKKIN